MFTWKMAVKMKGEIFKAKSKPKMKGRRHILSDSSSLKYLGGE